jgi:alpha-L-rhamnosidase
MIANMFLIQSLDLMAKCSDLLGLTKEKVRYEVEAMVVRKEFHDEYVTANGRIVSDSQAAYAIAICLNILRPDQRVHAANRLVYLVRKNNFRIATGFAGTPYICEALAITGHIQVAYAMLTEKSCPSWLYTVIMGGTTLWERWDSMLPDGSVNPGEMTSFNHYAFGSIAKFLYERVAGLQRVDAGWKTCLVAPAIGADFTQASASHMTPNGIISCSWKTKPIEDGKETMYMTVTVPRGTVMEVVLPTESEEQRQTVGFGEWDFQTTFRRDYEWPVLPLKPKS